MCGITGYTHRGRPFSPSAIQEATNCMTHRGPDQQGTFESPDVSLGAVRLKIIDLSAGNQPFFSDDRKTVLVYNGELYNYRELRKELEELGHSFSTHSDTEVLLHAFLQWDTACFSRLRGMFAAAFWQEEQRRLVLVRDRVGIKPLYIHRSGDDIFFGSELKTLFAHPEVPRRLDHHALHYYLTLNYVPGPYSLLEGIEKLRPGHFLEWRDGAVHQQQYWKLPHTQNDSWTMPAAEQELDKLLTLSVREHLLSDVPVGIWLSGGVDSSAVLHYAAQESSHRVMTFSITFQGRSFNEAPYIRQLVKQYKTDHYELDCNPALDLPSTIEEMAYYADEPFADAGAVPIWYLSKLSRQNAIVALSGEGADEFFGGYVTYQADHLAGYLRLLPAGARRSLLSALHRWPVSDEKISLEYKLKRFLEGSLLPPDEAHTYWNGAFSRPQQDDLLLRTSHARAQDLFDSDFPPPDRNGSLNRFLAFDQKYYLTDDLLQKVDRMSMAHSLEVRPPYLDHRIIEFASTLPNRFKVNGRTLKVVLKSLMKSKLPQSVIRRAKTGLDIPAHEWLRGPLRPLLEDTLRADAVKRTGLFRPAAIERVKRDHMERRANLGYNLWGLLILFLWIKHWNIQTSHELSLPLGAQESVSSPALS
ncbi:MAG TPA: asparagine synthase (glutamine-hydrolyzing) [Verrucomicrobiae bacterium]|nr:asparagine synthase (glutamine-hydrolyzing) [Verrucomicrobiae bacterium]